MAQLTIDAGEATDIFALLEDYGGRIEDIGDFYEFCNRRGYFAGHSLDTIHRQWGIRRIDTALKAKQPNGLPKCIHIGPAKKGVWVQLSLASQDEAFTAFNDLVKVAKDDLKQIRKLWDYLMDTFHDAPPFPKFDTDEDGEPDNQPA